MNTDQLEAIAMVVVAFFLGAQDRCIALLEAELQSLQQVLEQRVDAHEFDRQLARPNNEVRE